MKAKKYEVDEREIHLPEGCQYTAICWNCRSEQLALVEDGIKYTGTRLVRCDTPYIQFLIIEEDNAGIWIDNDSPVTGGFSSGLARQILAELKIAIEYLEQL